MNSPQMDSRAYTKCPEQFLRVDPCSFNMTKVGIKICYAKKDRKEGVSSVFILAKLC